MEAEELAAELAAFEIVVLVGLDASGCEFYLLRCEAKRRSRTKWCDTKKWLHFRHCRVCGR
jgi:hypothetical protein